MTDLDRITALGRPLDPTHSTNRLVLVLVPVAGLVGALIAAGGSAPWSRIAGHAVTWAGAAFLSWALARELAPDAERAAFGAMAAGVASLTVLPGPSLLLAFAALLLARMVARTVGPPARTVDSVVMGAVVIAAALRTDSWAVAAVGAIAFALDRRLRPAGPRRHVFWGWGCAGAAAGLLGRGVYGGAEGGAEAAMPAAGTGAAALGPLGTWALLAVAVSFAVRILMLRWVRSSADRGGAPLSPARVRAAMTIGLALALASQAPVRPTVEEAGVVWATLAALALLGTGPRCASG
jgi:hypothetical protein